MHENTNKIAYPEFLSRLQRELNILSQLGRKIEYAVSDRDCGNVSDRVSKDFQYLDLLIQSTDALEAIVDYAKNVDNYPSGIDIGEAVAKTPLREMASRMAAQVVNLPPGESQPNISGTVDLF